MVHPACLSYAGPSGLLTLFWSHLPSSLLPLLLPLACLAEEVESSHRKCWASFAWGAESVFSLDATANGSMPAYASCCPSLGKGSFSSWARGPRLQPSPAGLHLLSYKEAEEVGTLESNLCSLFRLLHGGRRYGVENCGHFCKRRTHHTTSALSFLLVKGTVILTQQGVGAGEGVLWNGVPAPRRPQRELGGPWGGSQAGGDGNK